jgi:hypothetical protein
MGTGVDFAAEDRVVIKKILLPETRQLLRRDSGGDL